MTAHPLSILLISRHHERVHYGFVLAAGAAALGRAVTVFATAGALLIWGAVRLLRGEPVWDWGFVALLVGVPLVLAVP